MNNRTWSAAAFVVGLIALVACTALFLTRSTTFLEVNESNFEEKVLKSDTPVFIEIIANDCGPCARQTPIIEKVAKDYAGKVLFVRLNASANQELGQVLQIKLVPTHIIFKPKDGTALKSEGVLNEASLRKLLDEALAPAAPEPPQPVAPPAPVIDPSVKPPVSAPPSVTPTVVPPPVTPNTVPDAAPKSTTPQAIPPVPSPEQAPVQTKP